jgi:hypothetical protein
MSGFFERLTGIIHWIGFLISLLIGYLLITETNNNGLLLNTFFILMPNTLGWLIKFIFTGNGKFLPF